MTYHKTTLNLYHVRDEGFRMVFSAPDWMTREGYNSPAHVHMRRDHWVDMGRPHKIKVTIELDQEQPAP